MEEGSRTTTRTPVLKNPRSSSCPRETVEVFVSQKPQLLDIGSSSRSHTDEPGAGWAAFHAPASGRSTDRDYVVGFHGDARLSFHAARLMPIDAQSPRRSLTFRFFLPFRSRQNNGTFSWRMTKTGGGDLRPARLWLCRMGVGFRLGRVIIYLSVKRLRVEIYTYICTHG
jgi:hypothetical protein